MTAGGVKLRLCPFCGSVNVRAIVSGVACVRCDDCGAEGPAVDPYDVRFEVTEDNIEALQEEAKARAEKAWNVRPWVGDFYPEDLEDMEKKMDGKETEDGEIH